MKKSVFANNALAARVSRCCFCLALSLLPLAAFAQTPPENPALTQTVEVKPVEEAKPALPTESKPRLAPENCKIRNFGKVTNQYFRGAQPKPEEYGQLAALGVKTVIDLRNDAEKSAKTQVEAAGIRYLNLAMSDTEYPPKEVVQRFLELVQDQANFPIFVHCRGGRHRTGIMTAVYRMTFEGWDVEKAYTEMKNFDFYTRWGHTQMKIFVYDYWKELQAKRKEAANAAPPTSIIP